MACATRHPQRPLDRLDTSELLQRYHHAGDLAARAELVERHRALAQRLALRYAGRGEQVDDLVQVALLGLIKAIDGYDPGRGRPLTAYAAPTIAGELKRHFRDRAWAVHVPRDLQERAVTLTRAMNRLSTRLGRSPSPSDLATELGWSVEQVLEAGEAHWAYRTVPLQSAPSSAGEGVDCTLEEAIGCDDPGYLVVEEVDALRDAARGLAPSEATALGLRVSFGLTQAEIGRRLGVSQVQVSRLLTRARERLRRAVDVGDQEAAA